MHLLVTVRSRTRWIFAHLMLNPRRPRGFTCSIFSSYPRTSSICFLSPRVYTISSSTSKILPLKTAHSVYLKQFLNISCLKNLLFIISILVVPMGHSSHQSKWINLLCKLSLSDLLNMLTCHERSTETVSQIGKWSEVLGHLHFGGCMQASYIGCRWTSNSN